MRFVLIAAACSLLAACASMSKGECLYADWKAVGYEDGAAGAPAAALSSRRQACAKAGVTPDMNAYLAGRDLGLAEYCTPANGFSTGEAGYSYSGACRQHDEASFVEQHRMGARLYSLRDRLKSADYALRHASEDLGSIQHEIAETTLSLIRPDLSVSQRAAQVVELTRLSEESDRVERSIPGLRQDVDLAQADLYAFETRLASRPVSGSQVAAR